MAARSRSPLVLAIVAFVGLDLGILLLNYVISWNLARDAVAINLSGRQRMLSQRTTKSALLATDARRPIGQRLESAGECARAWDTFGATLVAFAQGGYVSGGDGRRAHLSAVDGEAGLLVGKVMGLTREWPEAPPLGPRLDAFAAYMVAHNLEILDSMNQLTTALEHQSVALSGRLRLAQTLAFGLSLFNFAIILRLMHRARLKAEHDSRTDLLTGIANRAGLFAALEGALERTRAGPRPAGVLLLDLDGFKGVNDTHGHAAGDATLREVAHRLKTWALPGWTCGRIGGDEFVVVCTDAEPGAMPASAELLEQLLTGLPGGGMMVSASVGWAVAGPLDTADTLLMAADSRMYARKRNGAGERDGGRISGSYRRPAAPAGGSATS